MVTRVPVDESRGWRMKRGAAKAAQDQHCGKDPHGRGEADERQDADSQQRTADQQDARVPPVGHMPETQLRDRIRQLKAHLQRPGAGERQVEIGDEQREQRR